MSALLDDPTFRVETFLLVRQAFGEAKRAKAEVIGITERIEMRTRAEKAAAKLMRHIGLIGPEGAA